MAQPWPNVDAAVQMSTDGTTWLPVSPGLVEVSATNVQFRTVLTPTGGGVPLISDTISESFPTGSGSVEVSLDRSNDLAAWAGIAPGTEAVDPKIFLRVETTGAMSLVSSGLFTMGSPTDPAEPGRDSDEIPHEVTLTRSFYIQQTEVTKAQWDAVRAQGAALGLGYTDISVGQNGFDGTSGLPVGQNGFSEEFMHPVTLVSWNDVVKWLNLLSELHGLDPCYTLGGETHRTGGGIPQYEFDNNGYRLPTEAEWEYACRAGTTTAFYSGPITHTGTSPLDPNLDLIGWYGGNENTSTHPIGEKQPNAWGLYDTSGNVLEWCWDFYDSYDTGPVTDPVGPVTSGFGQRLLRGGAITNGILLFNAFECRSAYRNFSAPEFGFNYAGFRPVRTVVP
ncbi:SUMF1/EgtB/PvdO family nonheme iron enzyme [Puniceicoccales bacterium CK1056]|uniref:SUMF1/EgtB/PvdO family nonheme iron enzyme n=1 Tax=Oceanipulchritudo coccoides TaxID=2706888 RepID=A0A6B2M3D1_9BACT|nr:SUMF1/EgtB/PvdO family nonheme iron enzyme [Oceanipulchritudo coccoides]NDV62604.1 SUMF1/EgtB/PvdO family nonheme iron enzyme [Oceanipulchritudo coccoides]